MPKRWPRRIRGAVGMGLTWALAWFGAGMVLLLIVGPDAADVPFPIGFGFLGFLAGATFSGIVGLLEGRRSFDQMTLPRFAAWGGLGGLVFAGLFALGAGFWGNVIPVLVVGPVFALAGAGSAAGALALARRADDRFALDADGDVGAAELGGSDSRGLPPGTS